MIPLITAVAGVLSLISSISTLASVPVPAVPDPAEPAAGNASTASFSEALNGAINRLDDTVASANDKAKTFASGDQNVSLSDVMVSLEQADLALQTATAVREKIIAAYTNVMNMPV
jgi:flagellar hook-basal body complex protein FliE